MLRVLIAEDEALVRIGLVSAINWEANGYSLVGEASDGEEALELCRRLRPHIVITDIRMPRLDGLEFVRRLKDFLPLAKVLILSCHDEFNFAREALKLGVEDYLLKMDVSPATLVESLAVVKAKCLADPMDADSRDGGQPGILAMVETLLNGEEKPPSPTGGPATGAYPTTGSVPAVLPSPATGSVPAALPGPATAALDLAAALDPVFSKGRLVVLCLARDRSPEERDAPAGRGSLLLDSVLGLLRDCLKRQTPNLALLMPDGSIAAILAFDGVCSDLKLRGEIETSIGLVKESLSRSLGVSVSVGVSRARKGLEALAASWGEARQACGLKFFHGPDKVFFFGRPDGSVAGAEEGPDSQFAPKPGSIAQAVLDCDEARLLGMIHEATRYFLERGAKDAEVRLFFYRLTFDYIDQIETMGGDFRSVFADDVAWIERIMRAENIDEIARHAQVLTSRLLQFVKEHRGEHRQRIVARAHAYIDANYAADISLDSLSGHLAMNSSYFCKIYRQTTGGTFIERLTKVRLDKARTLLQSTDSMVYDIAGKVGYPNPEYFCRLFKKVTGLTPMQYRASSQQKPEDRHRT